MLLLSVILFCLLHPFRQTKNINGSLRESTFYEPGHLVDGHIAAVHLSKDYSPNPRHITRNIAPKNVMVKVFSHFSAILRKTGVLR